MKHIEVYSTNDCPWCIRARALLESKEIVYEDIIITSDGDRVQEMVGRSGRLTVPQIFINNESIGGFDELLLLSQSGKLY